MNFSKEKFPILLYCFFSFIVLFGFWSFKSSQVINSITFLEYKNTIDIFILTTIIYLIEKYSFFKRTYNIFILVFILFHLGIPISNIFSSEDSYFKSYINTWYYSNITIITLAIVNVFILSYFMSSIITYNKKFIGKFSFINLEKNLVFYKINAFLLAALVILWIGIVYIVFGVKDYSDIYAEGKSSILSYTLIFLPNFIAFSFLILITYKKYFYWGWIFFLLWAGFAFNLGIRGPVLFPLSLSIIILTSIYQYKITMLRFLLGLLTFCLVITYKFFSRAGLEIDITNINPLMAFQEMGSSLRPLNEVVVWLSSGLYNYQHGLTYFAPVERFFIGLFPLYSLPLDTEDIRLMNIAISQNAGPYGFSILAESYINFGLIGVVFLGVILAIILKKIDMSININGMHPISLIFLIALFFHIRQAFVGAWGVVLYLSAYFLIIYLISLVFGRRYAS